MSGLLMRIARAVISAGTVRILALGLMAGGACLAVPWTRADDEPFLLPLAEQLVATSQRFGSVPQLDLEAAVTQADLILVVKLADVTESKIVYGGKREAVTVQYRLEPVQVLKGVFAREALLLTDGDLRIGQFADAQSQMSVGDLFLVLLGRQGPGFFNCNSAQALSQSIPKLNGPDDPLIAAVKTLITVVMKRDRKERLDLIVRGLKGAKDRDAIALLSSLRRRALLAAQAPGATEAVIPLARSANPEVAIAAARTLDAIAAADYREQPALRRAIVDAVAETLEKSGRDIPLRLLLIEALGRCGPSAMEERAFSWLRVDRPISTFAERAARLNALRRLGATDQAGRLTELYPDLLLDTESPVEVATTRALVRLAPDRAMTLILDRFASKSDAKLSRAVEIRGLADLPKDRAVEGLLQVVGRSLDLGEQLTWADAARRVPDPRLIPTLTDWLDPRLHPYIYSQAQDALMAVDTVEAARALAPYLSGEEDLDRKLKIAEFLGHHGLKDGYVYAIEHISESTLRERAVAALAAIQEPKAIAELRQILDAGNDLNWTAAAMRGLGRLKVVEVAPQLLDAAADLNAPLAPDALIGLGDLGEERAIPLIREGLASRSDQVVIAAIRAATSILKSRRELGDDLRDAIAALLTNRSAATSIRSASLEALVSLDDARLPRALDSAVRDAALEADGLLVEIEKQLAAKKVVLEF